MSGIATVWLPVEDMDRAVAFYRDVLGLSVEQQEDDWTMLDAEGVGIGLNRRESPAGDGGAVIAFDPPGGDFDAGVEELTGQGVELESSEHPWGRIAAFRDPDGNALQLYAPPE
jgi:catechol 2,3-dioxygenase-like lactoylglutathione lyase family enzyme